MGPGLLNTNLGPGPVNTNSRPGPVNTNLRPGPGPGLSKGPGPGKYKYPMIWLRTSCDHVLSFTLHRNVCETAIYVNWYQLHFLCSVDARDLWKCIFRASMSVNFSKNFKRYIEELHECFLHLLIHSSGHLHCCKNITDM